MVVRGEEEGTGLRQSLCIFLRMTSFVGQGAGAAASIEVADPGKGEGGGSLYRSTRKSQREEKTLAFLHPLHF